MFFFFNECNAKRGNHFFSTLRIQYANVSLTHSGVDTVVVSRPELKNARAISRSETGNTTVFSFNQSSRCTREFSSSKLFLWFIICGLVSCLLAELSQLK